jgi:hypothetical protein
LQRDFTEAAFEELLEALLAAGYDFLPFDEYITAAAPPERTILLRHDVDRRPGFSVRFAEIEARHGIRGTFYFRIVPESFDEGAIRRIAALGHEVGYHYEDLALAGGDPPRAIALFEEHLRRLRAVCPIRTLCMHGSPLSAHDNRLLWRTYDYRDYDLVGEPYFDLDFERVFYLTDTGRRWDGAAVSVRDKVAGTGFERRFRGTREIIATARAGSLPPQIMITTHPQRWSDSLPLWTLELVGQRIKNVAKGALNVARRGS